MKMRGMRIMLLIGSAILMFSFIGCSSAPQSYGNAAEYMNGIYKFTSQIQNDMWEYVRTSAHIKDAKQINAKRLKVINTIDNAIKGVNKIEPYNDDFIFKNGVLEYLYLQSVILKEDYAKIMDLEAIADQSYDLMEAYLLAKKIANKKMEDAGQALEEKEQIFAKNNHISLTEISNDTTEKLKKAGEVMDYYNEIYLIFFKSNKQEWYVLDALNMDDISKTEQNRQTLITYSDEGLKSLNSIKPYESDDSIKNVCKNVLEYYKREAVELIPVFIDFLEKKEAYEQFKTSFDSKKDSEKTQEDVDTYNAKVKDLNDTVKKYDETNVIMNNDRKKYIDSWNETAQKFIDTHIPS